MIREPFDLAHDQDRAVRRREFVERGQNLVPQLFVRQRARGIEAGAMGSDAALVGLGVGLRVVELDQKRGRLYAIVMRVAAIDSTGPRKINVLAGFLDLAIAISPSLEFRGSLARAS